MNEREIFIAALHQRDAAERSALLDQACQGDASLRERVEELLREQERLGSFLEAPVAGLPSSAYGGGGEGLGVRGMGATVDEVRKQL